MTLLFDRVRADITDHSRGAGFFTVVVGTCVLGSQLFIVAGKELAAALALTASSKSHQAWRCFGGYTPMLTSRDTNVSRRLLYASSEPVS